MKNAKCKVQSEKWKIFVMLCCGAAVTKTHRASRREHSVKECHEVHHKAKRVKTHEEVFGK
jgi:hypothetical protein